MWSTSPSGRSKPLTAELLNYFKRWAQTVELPVFIQRYDKDEDLNEIDTLNSAADVWANEWDDQSAVAA